MVITGGLEGETGSAETEWRVKPQGGYVFRGDVDVLGTSIRTATGTGTKQQEEKTRNVEGGEEKDEIECEREKRKDREEHGRTHVSCDFNVILTVVVLCATWIEIKFNKNPFKVCLNSINKSRIKIAKYRDRKINAV